MTKINKINFTNVYISPNEKLTKPGIEPQNPRKRIRRLTHFNMNCMVITDKYGGVTYFLRAHLE
jgi:hypothetical protein